MSNRNNNQINVHEAKEAMNRFKMECANEVGVNLKQGYNGDLSSREAGSVGGQMVNVMCPVRHIEFSRVSRKEKQQRMVITYEYSLAVSSPKSRPVGYRSSYLNRDIS